MRKSEKITKGAISAITALGLCVAVPTLALADNGKHDANGHVQALVNANLNAVDNAVNHGNAHVNAHLNAHVNTHVNQHTNVHVNAHTNVHTNSHVNEHTNVHTNVHVNIHDNAHTNLHGNGHSNVRTNNHTNIHTNEHSTAHPNVHATGHINAHTNSHTNVHTNSHTNIHTNVHSNTHPNVHATGHTNIHTNVHVNVHLNEHGGAVGQGHIEDHLLAAIQNLDVSQTTYLYAYLENIQLNHTELVHIQEHVHQIDSICSSAGVSGTLSESQRVQVWVLYQEILAILQLHGTVTTQSGHTTSLASAPANQPVTIHIQDSRGHELASVPLAHPTSTSSIAHLANATQSASQASQQLSKNPSTSTAVTGELPVTSTIDPLMIALGLLLALLGGLGIGTAWFTSRKVQVKG